MAMVQTGWGNTPPPNRMDGGTPVRLDIDTLLVRLDGSVPCQVGGVYPQPGMNRQAPVKTEPSPFLPNARGNRNKYLTNQCPFYPFIM